VILIVTFVYSRGDLPVAVFSAYGSLFRCPVHRSCPWPLAVTSRFQQGGDTTTDVQALYDILSCVSVLYYLLHMCYSLFLDIP